MKKLVDIVEVAEKAYPYGLVREFFRLNFSDDGDKLHKDEIRVGDTLSEFIVKEIVDTYNGDSTEEVQLAEAYAAVRKAADELAGVAKALFREFRKNADTTIGRSGKNVRR